MIKILDITSTVIIAIIIIGFLSQIFFPIEGLELFYEKKFYLAFVYLAIRLSRNYLIKREQNQQ